MTTPSRKTDYLLLGALLVLVVLVALVTALLMPPQREGSFQRHPSTFYNERYGTKAAYLALRQMGYAATRLRRPIDVDTLDPIDALVILRPIHAMSLYEQEVLLRWVGRGHVLLVAPYGLSCAACGSGSGTACPTEWFNVINEDPGSEDERETIQSAVKTKTVDSLLDGVTTLVARRGQRFPAVSPLAGPLADRAATPVWTDALGTVAARVEYGSGTILALADVYALTNQGLDQADNGLWLANLAWALTGGRPDATLAFDEYHAGFPNRDPSWIAIARLMLTEGWGWSVGQGLVVAALALYARAVRFGRPRDLPPARRRRYGEFTAAGGRLLHDASAADLAYQTLYQYYRARTCRAMHLSPGADNATLASALAARGCARFAEWLPTAAPAARTQRLTRRDVLDLCQRMHHELEELEHGA